MEDGFHDYMVFTATKASQMQAILDAFGFDWSLRYITFVPYEGLIVVMETTSRQAKRPVMHWEVT